MTAVIIDSDIDIDICRFLSTHPAMLRAVLRGRARRTDVPLRCVSDGTDIRVTFQDKTVHWRRGEKVIFFPIKGRERE